jgi:hypothetical protein
VFNIQLNVFFPMGRSCDNQFFKLKPLPFPLKLITQGGQESKTVLYNSCWQMWVGKFQSETPKHILSSQQGGSASILQSLSFDLVWPNIWISPYKVQYSWGLPWDNDMMQQGASKSLRWTFFSSRLPENSLGRDYSQNLKSGYKTRVKLPLTG